MMAGGYSMKGRRAFVTFRFKSGDVTKPISDTEPEPPPEGADDAALQAHQDRLLVWYRQQAGLTALAHKIARGSGGKASTAARRKKRAAVEEWLTPVFDEAFAQLEAECFARIGADKLVSVAWRIVGKDHPDHHRRGLITVYRARKYLETRSRARR